MKLESEQPPNSAHTALQVCERELASFHTSWFGVDELVADVVNEFVEVAEIVDVVEREAVEDLVRVIVRERVDVLEDGAGTGRRNTRQHI